MKRTKKVFSILNNNSVDFENKDRFSVVELGIIEANAETILKDYFYCTDNEIKGFHRIDVSKYLKRTSSIDICIS